MSLKDKHDDHREENQRYYEGHMKHWRAWGSWFSWGSPVGLGLFFVLLAVAFAVVVWIVKI
jgi:hypothetical protein